MKKVTAALTVLLALTLAGCAGGSDDAADERTTPSASESSEPEETAAPLTAETEQPVDSADSTYLSYIRESLQPDTQIGNASESSLVEAGHKACEQLQSGVNIEDVRVVEGETPNASGYYADSLAIRNAAQVAYCPETL